MKTMQVALVSMLLVAVSLVSPLTTFAQDLSQTFTSMDGTFTFQYPAEWVGEDFGGTLLIGNSDAAIDAFMGGVSMPAGQVLLVILTPTEVGDTAGNDAAAVLSTFLDDMAQGAGGGIQTDTLGGKPVAFSSGAEEGQMLVVYAVDFGANGFALTVQITAPGEEGDFVPTTRAIIETMAADNSAFPQEAVPDEAELSGGADGVAVTGGTVVWQRIYDIDPAGQSAIMFADDLVVGPDDAIYVLDSAAGIHVFSADGDYLRLITPDAGYGTLIAFDMADDGTLWAADFYGEITRFDSEGTVLGSFELPDSVEIAFFNVDLAVGPDGNLYLLNPRAEGDVSLGEVLVFTPAGDLVNTFVIGEEDYYTASITFGSDGLLYVAESFGEQGIQVFDANGIQQREGIGMAELYTIADIAVGADGSIYTGLTDGPLYHYASDGTLLNTFGESLWMQDDFDFDAEVIPHPAPGVFYNVGAVGVLSNGDVVAADTSLDWWQLVRFSFAE